MTYKYRNYGKKKYYKRSKYSQGARTAMKIGSNTGYYAYKAFQLAKFATSVLNPEKKIQEVSAFGLTAFDSGSIQCLSQIPQGSTALTRNGNSVKSANIQFRLTVSLHPSTTQLDNLVRILIVIDTNQDQNSSFPVVTDVLQNADQVSPLNFGNLGRFSVLVDKTIMLNGPGAQSIKQFNVFKKLTHHIRFAGAGTSPSNLRQGQLYFIILSNQATNAPQYDYHSRLKYYDN